MRCLIFVTLNNLTKKILVQLEFFDALLTKECYTLALMVRSSHRSSIIHQIEEINMEIISFLSNIRIIRGYNYCDDEYSC